MAGDTFLTPVSFRWEGAAAPYPESVSGFPKMAASMDEASQVLRVADLIDLLGG